MRLDIVPVNDLEVHELGTTCKCAPKFEEHYGSIIVVHNSFDQREVIERINTQLGLLQNQDGWETIVTE